MVTTGFSLWSEEIQDQQQVKAALHFANSGDPAAWEAVCGRRPADGSPSSTPNPAFLAAERSYLRTALSTLLGHANPPPEMLSAWQRGLRAVPISLVHDDDTGEFKVTIEAAEPPEEPPSPAMALTLLLLRQGPRVCRCAACRKFFLERSTGGMSRRKYCQKECMNQAHRATVAERVRRSRLKRKQRAIQKRRRRS